jgi:hypothetical protein
MSVQSSILIKYASDNLTVNKSRSVHTSLEADTPKRGTFIYLLQEPYIYDKKHLWFNLTIFALPLRHKQPRSDLCLSPTRPNLSPQSLQP